MQCFVIMPFGDSYKNSYYEEIIKPAAQSMGYEVKRADEIYGTRPIISDIFNCIKDADLLIADVSGKNPNVNYELGIAHAFEKEVIILSSDISFVPFDYCHRRVLIYDTEKVNWAADLKNHILKTIEAVERDARAANDAHTDETECVFTPTSKPSVTTARATDAFFYVNTRCGTINKAIEETTLKILNKIREIKRGLPENEFFCLRSVFVDIQPSIIASIDYIYDCHSSPSITTKELEDIFHFEDDGVMIDADIRLIRADIRHDHFDLFHDDYYVSDYADNKSLGYWVNRPPKTDDVETFSLMATTNDGYYTAKIVDVISNSGGSHYKLDSLIPVFDPIFKGQDYVHKESHWLSLWHNKIGSTELYLHVGEIVKFKIQKLFPPREFNKTNATAARDITPSEIIVNGECYKAKK